MAKKAAPKAAAKAKAAPAGNEKKAKARTKGEIFASLAEATGLSKKQVAAVFDELAEMIKNDLGKKGPGQFTLPGLLKLKVAIKAAIPAGPRMNQFTKQMENRPAKPASRVVRARPLKALKDMV